MLSSVVYLTECCNCFASCSELQQLILSAVFVFIVFHPLSKLTISDPLTYLLTYIIYELVSVRATKAKLYIAYCAVVTLVDSAIHKLSVFETVRRYYLMITNIGRNM